MGTGLDDVSYEYIFGKEGAKMIRVLMCGPLADSGGVSNHTKHLVKNLSRNGIEVIFHNFNEKTIKQKSLSKIYQRTLGLLIFAIRKRKEYDIMHIQSSGGIYSFTSALTGCVVSNIVNRKIIITFHHSKTKSFINKYKRFFEFVLKQTNKMVLVSNSQKNTVNYTFPQYEEKIEVIPNGYDPTLFYQIDTVKARKIVNIDSKTKNIVNVSNLIDSKGHKYLI
ncbi:MAG: glycosyltransferase family 4 protein [bacterium]